MYVPRLLIKHSNDLEIMRITRGILPLGDHPTSFAQHVIVDKPVQQLSFYLIQECSRLALFPLCCGMSICVFESAYFVRKRTLEPFTICKWNIQNYSPNLARK